MPRPAYLHPKRPSFWLDGFTDPVRSELVHFDRLLWGFWEYMARFDDAFQLSAQSTALKLVALDEAVSASCKYPLSSRKAWKHKGFDEFHRHLRINAIAHRDAGMSVFHGAKGLAAINRFAKIACEPIRSRIDFTPMRAASPLFKRLFPNAHKIRHALSHAGESNADQRMQHKSEMCNYLETPFINGAAFGAQLSVSHEGKLLKFELTQEHVDGLREVTCLIRGAILPVEAWTRRRANRFLGRQVRAGRLADQTIHQRGSAAKDRTRQS